MTSAVFQKKIEDLIIGGEKSEVFFPFSFSHWSNSGEYVEWRKERSLIVYLTRGG
jgi:hypothetical protein